MEMTERLQRYFQVRRQLATWSNQHIHARLQEEDYTQGWGVNQQLVLHGVRVFVKRLPLTTREMNAPYSTRNLFQLPMAYHYGVGSAGFGSFRELAAHVKTTDWVLSGACAHFPLLYGARLLKSTAPWRRWSAEKQAEYLRYWGGSARIRDFVCARQRAPYELVLFLEYIPSSLFESFASPQAPHFRRLMQEASAALAFLQKHGILHLDAHAANLLSDGQHCYVSDFGLVLDGAFELSAPERRFLATHQDYDQAELMGCGGILLAKALEALPADTREALYTALGIEGGSPLPVISTAALQDLDRLEEHNVPLPDGMMAYVREHREAILYMNAFFDRLCSDPRKRVRFQRERWREALQVTQNHAQ